MTQESFEWVDIHRCMKTIYDNVITQTMGAQNNNWKKNILFFCIMTMQGCIAVNSSTKGKKPEIYTSCTPSVEPQFSDIPKFNDVLKGQHLLKVAIYN